MFGVIGYSVKVAGALYDIGITGAPPNRINQVEKTYACKAGKKGGLSPEETALFLYAKNYSVSKYSPSVCAEVIEDWVAKKKIRARLWDTVVVEMEEQGATFD